MGTKGEGQRGALVPPWKLTVASLTAYTTLYVLKVFDEQKYKKIIY